MHRKMFVIHIVLLVCLVSTSSAGAQTFTGAQVTGVIRDSNGGVTPGATITATNTETNLMRQTLSNENGVYTLPALPIGVYDITAELAGFQTEVQKGLKLQVGDNLRGAACESWVRGEGSPSDCAADEGSVGEGEGGAWGGEEGVGGVGVGVRAREREHGG